MEEKRFKARVTVGVHRKGEEAMPRGCRRRSCGAVMTPSRPSFGGPHAHAYTEGSRRRSVSYADGPIGGLAWSAHTQTAPT
jgi:hypothetical protein